MPDPRLPEPFTEETKVLVLAGSNELPPERQRRREARIAMGEEEIPLLDKSFLELRGRRVVEYVLETLLEVGLRRIWVLARPERLEQVPDRYDVRLLAQRPRATIGSNLAAAYASVIPEEDEPVLIVFGDHPLMTPTALVDFLAGCAPELEEADFFHAVATTRSYYAYADYFHRTSVFSRDLSGRASGLNLAVPSRIRGLRAFDHMYSVRKQEQIGRFLSLLSRAFVLLGAKAPIAVLDAARLWIAKEFEKVGRRPGRIGRFGAAMVRFLRRQVPTRRIESYGAQLFGTQRGFRLIPLDHGGAAVDVDFIEELAVLEREWDSLLEIARRQDRGECIPDVPF